MSQRNVFSFGSSKLLFYRSHLETWLHGGQPDPITLEIHPSERCNHRCPSCQSKLVFPTSEVRARAAGGADLDPLLLKSVW